MVIVALIIIIRRQDLIVMDRPLWLCQDIAHLHEEVIMAMVEAEEEDGKINFKKPKYSKVVAYCYGFFVVKRLSL
jgi:hypothetical protein